MLALGSREHVRVFRNNVGKAKTSDGRYIVYGLHVGSGDLVGWQTVTITPDMVGQKFARFLSVEVKTPSGRIRHEQYVWQNNVNAAGGVAVIARSVDDVIPL